MKGFINDNFLLENETAIRLYHDYAKKMPIIDFHSHLSAKEIYENKQFKSITEVWLGGDHYKWRGLRTLGVSENYITGNESDFEKFKCWAKSVPYLIGNPLYHWTHLELERYFNIKLPLNEKTAQEIFERTNELLNHEAYRVRGLIEMMNVEVICTTDDPCDELKYHQLLQEEGYQVKILPTFRPDKAVNIEFDWFNTWINELESVVKFRIETIHDLFTALDLRMQYFNRLGCRLSDNALDTVLYCECTKEEAEQIFAKARRHETLTQEEIAKYKTHVILFLTKKYQSYNWVMQIHMGAMRNNNSKMFEHLGPDTGYDCINNSVNIQNLSKLLDSVHVDGELPKIIFYDLNPSDHHKLVTFMQCYQDGLTVGKMQFGSAWWFNDHLEGMKAQLLSLAANGVLSTFVGMLTDSRSFLSFPRHEYFRRILCQILGEYLEKGQCVNDLEFLGKISEAISYENAKQYFNF